MTCCTRLTSAGRITNWEMEILRGLPHPQDTKWNHVWVGLSDPFHPKSEQEWKDYLAQREDP